MQMPTRARPGREVEPTAGLAEANGDPPAASTKDSIDPAVWSEIWTRRSRKPSRPATRSRSCSAPTEPPPEAQPSALPCRAVALIASPHGQILRPMVRPLHAPGREGSELVERPQGRIGSAILVDNRKRVIGLGFNGFPDRIPDDIRRCSPTRKRSCPRSPRRGQRRVSGTQSRPFTGRRSSPRSRPAPSALAPDPGRIVASCISPAASGAPTPAFSGTTPSPRPSSARRASRSRPSRPSGTSVSRAPVHWSCGLAPT